MRALVEGQGKGEFRAEERAGHGRIGGIGVKGHAAFVIAKPDLTCSTHEVKGAFGEKFVVAIGGGHDFDTNLRGQRQTGGAAVGSESVDRDPCNVGSFDSVWGLNAGFRENAAVRQE